MLKAWQDAQAESPTVEIRRRLHFTHGSVTLEDWLEQLHGDGSEGKPVWLALDPGRLCTDAKKGLVRTHRMVLPWVRSLVAAVSQVPVQGVLVGRDATLRIRPMAAETARTSLTMLVDIWREGLSGPLPLALRTALAHVDGKRPADTYDGSYQQQGESEEPCLGRAYPDFETLSEDGRFEAMAEMVYGPLAAWVTEHVSATAHPDTVHADESAAP
jgi:exodeoxyribonuclease V gamma subunit